MNLEGVSVTDQLRDIVARVAAAVRRSRPKIVVIGDVMLDEYLTGSVDRISPEAPIPVVACNSHSANPGGAANVAANLASLGAEAIIISIIGGDEAGARLRAALETLGVQCRHLLVAEGRPTTRKLRVVSGGQQIVRVDFEECGALEENITARLEHEIETAFNDCDAVIVSDYNKGVCNPDLLSRLMPLARGRGLPVLCDPKGHNFGKYHGASVITPNRREAGEAVGSPDISSTAIEAAAESLRQTLSLEACLVTLGAEGMLLAEPDAVRRVGAFTREVADVTGAGDSVIAALCLALTAGLSIWQGVLFANAVAAIAVSRHGSAAVELDDVISTYGGAVEQSSRGKIIPRSQVHRMVSELREQGRSIVFTNGCFDVLHAGHVENLEQCASFGSFLMVGLNDDDSVRRLKGPARPINESAARARVISALRSVDCVVVFSEDTPEELISDVRPDVLVKGSDYIGKYVAGQKFVESYGGRVEFVGLKPGYSSTNLIRKLEGSTS